MPDESQRPEAEYLTVKDVAKMTKSSESYFNKLRSSGGGPTFHKISSRCVRYDRRDVDAWLADRRRASTFDDRKVSA